VDHHHDHLEGLDHLEDQHLHHYLCFQPKNMKVVITKLNNH